MQRLLSTVLRISRWMNVLAEVALAFIILITVADVILRSFKRPILGTYELVALSGGIIIGFSIPITSWMKAHIYVDFVVLKFSDKGKKAFKVATKCLGIILFVIIGANLLLMGLELYQSGEVSPTLHIPFYPMVWSIGACCFFQCLVLFCDIVKTVLVDHE
jgi:TRAP-type C4-dicarboxylate transport system permease small subunit